MDDSSDMEDLLDDDFLEQNIPEDQQLTWDEEGEGGQWGWGAGNGEEEKWKGESLMNEIWEVFILTLGCLGSRISWVAIKTTDSALLGHTPNPDALTISSYSDLYTSAVGVLLASGVLSMFVGNAIGSGNKEMAGVWLQISMYFVLVMTLPVMILWFLTSPVLQLFGVPKEMANQAGYYSIVLAFCLPFRSVFRQLTQFLAAQKIVYPGTVTGVLGCGFNLVMGLIFVLGIPIPGWEGWGFKACPFVTLGTEILMCLVFYVAFFAILELHKEGWGGMDMSLLTDWEKFKEFGRFYVPTALQAASDWWRVTVIGVVAAYLGKNELAVFNTSYRILWMSLTVVGSLATAISIRLGILIGAGDVVAAKRTVNLGIIFTLVLLVFLCAINWILIEQIARVFSDKQEIIDTFVDSRMGICCMLFVMNLSVFLEKIPNTLGKNKQVLYTGLVGSWCGQVPAVLAFCYFISWSLNSIYMGASFGYALTCVLLTLLITKVDWKEAVKEAKERSGAGEVKEDEGDDDEVWGVEGGVEMKNIGVNWEKFVEEEEEQDIF